MRIYRLREMKKGWFIGDYPKAVRRSKGFEIAVKEEKAGERVKRHFHGIAAEITVIIRGRVRINDKKFKKGDIIVIKPRERADYEVLEDAITVIVKIPSVMHDKYFVERKI